MTKVEEPANTESIRAHGVVNGDGSLLPFASYEPDALWVLLSELFGIDDSKIKSVLEGAGYRAIDVEIRRIQEGA